MIRKFVLPVVRGGALSVSDGVVAVAGGETFNIRASVQPLKDGEVMQMLSEGREAREFYRLYTDTELFTAEKDRQADKVTVYGKEFEVASCEYWQNGIRSHYKAVVIR